MAGFVVGRGAARKDNTAVASFFMDLRTSWSLCSSGVAALSSGESSLQVYYPKSDYHDEGHDEDEEEEEVQQQQHLIRD